MAKLSLVAALAKHRHGSCGSRRALWFGLVRLRPQWGPGCVFLLPVSSLSVKLLGPVSVAGDHPL